MSNDKGEGAPCKVFLRLCDNLSRLSVQKGERNKKNFNEGQTHTKKDGVNRRTSKKFLLLLRLSYIVT